MKSTALAAALEREHRTIDDVFDRCAARPSYSEGPHNRERPDARALAEAIAALRRHIYLEEELLFPALHAVGDARVVAGMLAGLREHARIWHLLDELEQESNPAAAARLSRMLLVALQHHNLHEARVVYPAVDESPVAARLVEFVESGQMPNGWVCIRARS